MAAVSKPRRSRQVDWRTAHTDKGVQSFFPNYSPAVHEFTIDETPYHFLS